MAEKKAIKVRKPGAIKEEPTSGKKKQKVALVKQNNGRRILTRIIVRNKKPKLLTADALSYLNFLRRCQRISLKRESNNSMMKKKTFIKRKVVPKKRLVAKPKNLTTALAMEKKTQSKIKLVASKDKVVEASKEKLAVDSENTAKNIVKKVDSKLARVEGGGDVKKVPKKSRENESKLRLHPAARLKCNTGALHGKMPTNEQKTLNAKLRKKVEKDLMDKKKKKQNVTITNRKFKDIRI